MKQEQHAAPRGETLSALLDNEVSELDARRLLRDMTDADAERLGRWQLARALQFPEFGEHRVQWQALAGTGLLQRHLATAAEVELEAAEDGGGARQFDGDLSDGLAGAVQGVGGGEGGVHGRGH